MDPTNFLIYIENDNTNNNNNKLHSYTTGHVQYLTFKFTYMTMQMHLFFPGSLQWFVS